VGAQFSTIVEKLVTKNPATVPGADSVPDPVAAQVEAPAEAPVEA
jgi:hypothetical protein